MGPKLGSYIKFKRVEQNITQESLCEGICTPSYLSRIENNRVIADNDIYKLLLERLGLNFNTLKLINQEKDGRIENWYEAILLKKDLDDNPESFLSEDFSHSIETRVKYDIVLSRYLIKIGEYEQAKNILDKIKNLVVSGYNRNFFIYTNTLLLYFYKICKYKEAIEAGKELLKIRDYKSLGKDYEVGIFFYNLALSYMKNYNYDKARFFSEESLAIFNNGYYLEQALASLILLGISYNNLGNYKAAINSYTVAFRLIKYIPQSEQKRFLGIIHNNLGYTYEEQKSFTEAIMHYNQSMDYKSNKDKVPIINKIIRCYIFIDDKKSARYWLKIGLEKKDKETPSEHTLQLEVFSLILSNESSVDKISTLQERSISYFRSHQMWKYTEFFCIQFAMLYEKHHFYKKANQMYKIVLEAKEKLLGREEVKL